MHVTDEIQPRDVRDLVASLACAGGRRRPQPACRFS
jgi:hypothetical protein